MLGWTRLLRWLDRRERLKRMEQFPTELFRQGTCDACDKPFTPKAPGRCVSGHAVHIGCLKHCIECLDR